MARMATVAAGLQPVLAAMKRPSAGPYSPVQINHFTLNVALHIILTVANPNGNARHDFFI